MVPLDVAKARGQGSGWFSPYGDAALPGEPSLSLEYVFKEKEGAPVFAYGVERVAMAASARLETWEHTLPAFKAAAKRSRSPYPWATRGSSCLKSHACVHRWAAVADRTGVRSR